MPKCQAGFSFFPEDLLAIQHTFYALSATHQLSRIYPVEPCTQPALSGVDLYCYHPNQYAMNSLGAAEAIAVHTLKLVFTEQPVVPITLAFSLTE